MKTRRVSVIIFYDKDYRLLLQDRTGISKVGEEWAFFGGGMKQGESPEQTLLRETEEELEFKLTDYEFIGQHSNKIGEEWFVDRHAYISHLDDLSLLTQKEGTNMQFFTLKEAKELKMVPGDYSVLLAIEEALSITWAKVSDIYDLETLQEGFTGNLNKLEKEKIDGMVALGKEGLLEIMLSKESARMNYQWFNGKLTINNGNHRSYSAYKLGIKEIPIGYETHMFDNDPTRKLIPISEWDVLAKEELKKYDDSF